jgi:hypothetical protein
MILLFPKEENFDFFIKREPSVYTQVGFTPLNPPEYRGETRDPVPSPLQLRCTHKLSDPPKSPLKRGTLIPIPPLKRGARGDQNAVRQLYKTCVYTVAPLQGEG